MKFLIDECLTPELALRARKSGYSESSHVCWIGRRGAKDWQLKALILNGDWTFVTRNSVDFRGSSTMPGNRGQYAGVDLHAGLICLNSPLGMDLDLQIELFDCVLEELNRDDDLVNQVLEISLEGDDLRIRRYRLPAVDS